MPLIVNFSEKVVPKMLHCAPPTRKIHPPNIPGDPEGAKQQEEFDVDKQMCLKCWADLPRPQCEKGGARRRVERG